AGLFLLQDSSELERLISSLGSDSAEVRQKSEERLIELGPKALEALRKASAGSDQELRARAQSALSEIQRVEGERRYDLREKERLLGKNRGDPEKKEEQSPGTVFTGAARFGFSVKPFQKGLVLYTFPWNYMYLEGRWEEISFDLIEVQDKTG